MRNSLLLVWNIFCSKKSMAYEIYLHIITKIALATFILYRWDLQVYQLFLHKRQHVTVAHARISRKIHESLGRRKIAFQAVKRLISCSYDALPFDVIRLALFFACQSLRCPESRFRFPNFRLYWACQLLHHHCTETQSSHHYQLCALAQTNRMMMRITVNHPQRRKNAFPRDRGRQKERHKRETQCFVRQMDPFIISRGCWQNILDPIR